MERPEGFFRIIRELARLCGWPGIVPEIVLLGEVGWRSSSTLTRSCRCLLRSTGQVRLGITALRGGVSLAA